MKTIILLTLIFVTLCYTPQQESAFIEGIVKGLGGDIASLQNQVCQTTLQSSSSLLKDAIKEIQSGKFQNIIDGFQELTSTLDKIVHQCVQASKDDVDWIVGLRQSYNPKDAQKNFKANFRPVMLSAANSADYINQQSFDLAGEKIGFIIKTLLFN